MAGITPNPKKRGFLLPPGCKDLYDVLQGQHSKKRASVEEAQILAAALKMTVTREAPAPGQVSELGSHLARMAASQAWSRSLQLLSLDHEFGVQITQGENLPLHASLSLEIGTEQNRLMRKFCTQHGFALPDDKGTPKGFLFDLPMSQIYRLSPLPADISQATKLLTALLQEVAGLTEQTEIFFMYRDDQGRLIILCRINLSSPAALP